MQEEEKHYETLRKEIERTVERKMATPRDFNHLSKCIFDKTRVYISSITLKRFWGYLGESRKTKPYRYTLNTLAQYAGYHSIEELYNDSQRKIESELLTSNSIETASLQKGDKIQLCWHPDRCVTICYEGMDKFRVTESVNSKLSVGDTFLCNQNHSICETLYTRETAPPTTYAAE